VSNRRKSNKISKRERNFWALIFLSLVLALVTWRQGVERSASLVVSPTDPAVLISAEPTPAYDCASNNPFNEITIANWTATHSPGTFNATVLDLVNDCTYAIGNPEATFPMASTGKVLIATAILEMVARAEIDYPSVQADLTAMITQSDNAAADRMFAKMGRAVPMQELEVRYGLTQTTTDRGWGTTFTNSADQAKFLNQVLGKQESSLPQEQRQILRNLMQNVNPEQAWGAGTNVPTGWSVAVKNGWYQAVVGDIPPVGKWRVNTVGMTWDQTDTPRWIFTAFSNEWPTQSAGVNAWNDLAKLISTTFNK